MSAAHLGSVQLIPELTKPIPADPKPSEAGSGAFLAILDRALDAYEPITGKGNEYSQPVTEQRDAHTIANTPYRDVAEEPKTQQAGSRLDQVSGERTMRDGKKPDIQAQNQAVDIGKRNIAHPHAEKYREDRVRQLPKTETKSQNGGEETERVRPLSETQSGKIRMLDMPAAETVVPLEEKTGQRVRTAVKKDEQVSHGALPIVETKIPGGVKAEVAQLVSRSAGEARVSEKTADWSGLNGQIRGLQDAMQTVQNLAQKLGLGAEQNPVTMVRHAENASKSAVQALGKSDKQGDAGNTIADLRGKRFEQLRFERSRGRENEAGQVAVDDHRTRTYSTSLVLDTLLGRRGQEPQTNQAALQNQNLAARVDLGPKGEGLNLFNTSFLNPSGGVVTISMPSPVVASNGATYQQTLRQWLDKSGNSEIVQQAKIVLNGNNSGEIRLILKPENLGEVRINLQLQEGRIGGTIFVENKEVQSVFEETIAELRQAFEDGGLSTGDLSVNVNGRGSGNGGYDRPREESDAQRTKYAVERLEQGVSRPDYIVPDYGTINLVV